MKGGYQLKSDLSWDETPVILVLGFILILLLVEQARAVEEAYDGKPPVAPLKEPEVKASEDSGPDETSQPPDSLPPPEPSIEPRKNRLNGVEFDRMLEPVSRFNRRIQDISSTLEEITSTMVKLIQTTYKLRGRQL